MTKIALESDEEFIIRKTQDDEPDTWFNLTEIFFEELQGMGYSLPSTPEHMREILEDFHDTCMAEKYPREQKEKTENTPEEIEMLKRTLGDIKIESWVMFTMYDGTTVTRRPKNFTDVSMVACLEGAPVDLKYIQAWKLV